MTAEFATENSHDFFAYTHACNGVHYVFPGMLILGLGLDLKAKFLGLDLGTVRPWP